MIEGTFSDIDWQISWMWRLCMCFQGDNGKFSFLLYDPHDAFTINSSTGVISVKNSMLLDYEDVKAKHFVMYVSIL